MAVAQVHLILTIIDHQFWDKEGKPLEYTGVFSEVFMFNNNGQIDDTTGMLSVRRWIHKLNLRQRTLQAFRFYDLTSIIRLVHLVLKDLPDLTASTPRSYYVNNYIDWDEYNWLYSSTFDQDWTRIVRDYRRKRARFS
jgi:hypothetical protein